LALSIQLQWLLISSQRFGYQGWNFDAEVDAAVIDLPQEVDKPMEDHEEGP
jgi:hypothetical protein